MLAIGNLANYCEQEPLRRCVADAPAALISRGPFHEHASDWPLRCLRAGAVDCQTCAHFNATPE
jgi:hypothetical protein